MVHLKNINELFGFGKKPSDEELGNDLLSDLKDQHPTIKKISRTIGDDNITEIYYMVVDGIDIELTHTTNYSNFTKMLFPTGDRHKFEVKVNYLLVDLSYSLKRKIYITCEDLYNKSHR